MSACSSRLARLMWALAAEAVLGAAILAIAVFALSPALAGAATSDAHQVKRVTVGSRGIVLETGAGSDTLERDRTFRTRTRVSTSRHGWIEVDDDSDALVRVFSDAHVPAGETVAGDVVAVFGSVDVEGKVEGDVVAVLGSVHLHPGSAVAGDAVSIGGALDQADGVEVGGETVSVGFMPAHWGIPAVSLTLSAVMAGWLSAVVTGWLLVTLFPRRTVRVAAMASRRTSASLLLGLLSIPLFVAAVFLLFVTVVGIPLAILLPPAYFLLCMAGQLAAIYVLGCKLTGRPLGVGGMMAPILAGSLLVAAFFVLGAGLFVLPGITRPLALFSVVLGALMLLGLTAIGTGAFLLSKLGSEPSDVEWTPGPLAPAANPGLSPPPTVTGA